MTKMMIRHREGSSYYESIEFGKETHIDGQTDIID